MINFCIRQVFKVGYFLKLRYNQCFFPKARGVYVAVWYQHQLLIIQNSYKSTFTLPCGGIRQGETAVAAAQRELREEVGLSLPQQAFLPFACYESHVEHMQDRVTLFHVELASPAPIHIDHREVISAAFMPLYQAKKLTLFFIAKNYVDDIYLSYQEANHVNKS